MAEYLQLWRDASCYAANRESISRAGRRVAEKVKLNYRKSMYVIVPQRDSIKHDLTSGACDCRPRATILSNGEILLVHERVSTSGESKWVMTTEPDSLEIEERRTFERLIPKPPKGRRIKEGGYPNNPD